MKILLDNIQTKIIIGGMDDLRYPGIFNDLRDYLSIDVPGAYFSPQYKRRQWDGKKYFLTPTGKMPTGFLPVLAKHLDRDYPDLDIEVIDERKHVPAFKLDMVSKIGSKFAEDEYAYQMDAIRAMDFEFSLRGSRIRFPRGISNAATNAGKTAIMAGVHLNLEGDNTMLILIHQKTIFNQLVEAFEEIYGDDVGIINAKHYKPNKITIGMIKTVYNRMKESTNVKKDIAKFGVVAVDEAHLAGSKTYLGVLRVAQAPVRVFVSGTPFDSDDIVNKMIAIGLSGPELYHISKRELMDKGISLEAKVRIHLCNEPGGLTAEFDYRQAMDIRIHKSAKRAAIMADIIRKHKGSTLIAVKEIEHGQLLSTSLQLLTNRPITFVHGEDPEREEKIRKFKDGEIDVLISTTILKEGVNIPIISNIIYAAGGKSKVDIKQWMGRGERRHEDMKEFTFHDFYDIGSYVESHSRSRIAAYKKEKLDVREHYDRKIIQKIHLGVLHK